MWNRVYAQAQEAAQDVAASGTTEEVAKPNPLTSMLPMLALMFVVMYFLMIRPQQKQEKSRKAMLASMTKGDRVVTAGGICGTVIGLSEKTCILRVSEDPPVKMEFLRSSVSQVTSRDEKDEKK